MQRFVSRRAVARSWGMAVLVMAGLAGCAHRAGTYGVSTSVAPNASNAAVTIVNSSRESIFYVYISPTSQNTWGADQLGRNTILVGHNWRFTMNPGEWDIKVVDRSGNYKVFAKQILNAGQAYTLTIDAEGWTAPSRTR